MVTPPASWFPWQRFQVAVGVWATRALGFDPAVTTRSVIWADFDLERPALPYLGLQVTGGPSRRAQDAEQWPRQLPQAVSVQVLPTAYAAPGALSNLFVNGDLFTYSALVGDGAAEVRDALLAQAQASLQLGATAVASSIDSIVFTADRPGSLDVEAALGCEATVLSTQLVALTIGAREIRVRATAYGAPEPNGLGQVSVAEWIELLAEATQDPDLRLYLRRQGLAVARVQMLQTRLSALSGAEREPRSAADLMFAYEVRRGRLITSWLDEVIVKPPNS